MTTDRTLDRDVLAELIAEHLSGTYHCTRVWSAWGVGTMTQDDFEPVDESDTPGEIADAIIAKLNADRTQSAQADHLPDSGNMIGAQAVAEPHPPTRHCMCADCLPSFDDTEALPTPKAEPAPIPKYQTPHDFKNFHRQLCARFGYVHDEQFWWRDLVSLIEHIASKAQPAVEPVATGKWFTVVYKNVVPGDEAALIGSHPKASALSWSHAMDDRDEALAKLAAAPNALDASDTALLDCLDQQGYAYGFQDMHEGNHWEIRGAYRTVRDALRAELAAQSAQGGV